MIIPALGHQNKGKSSFTGSGLFVLRSLIRLGHGSPFGDRNHIITLLSSFFSCSTNSACWCRVVFGVQIGLAKTCSTALDSRSNWFDWLLDITAALFMFFNWFIASERSCL